MSLLMDALKRAERAREAKERVGGDDPQEASAIPELSLDPVDNSETAAGMVLEGLGTDTHSDLSLAPADEREASGARPPTPGESTTHGATSGSMNLALEPTDASPVRAHPGEVSDSLSLDLELPSPFVSDVAPLAEDTSATLPSLKAVQASVNSYFDGTDSVSVSMEAVPSESFSEGATTGATTTITGKRLGEEVEAQMAAQRIFDSKGPPPAAPDRGGRGGRFVVFVLLPLLLVFGGGLGVWYFVEQASAPSLVRGQPQPQSFLDSVVALFVGQPPVRALPPAGGAPRGVLPGGAPAPAPALGAPPPGTGTVAGVAGAEPTDAELVRRAREALAAGNAALAQSGEAALDPTAPVPVEADLSVKPPEPKIVEAPAPAPPPASPAPAPAPQLSDAQFATALEAAKERLPEATPEPGTIRIARAARVDRVSPSIATGFAAYQRGDLAVARRAYAQALRRQGNNRDALLGAAAVAVREGRSGDATGYYQRLLALNPRDTVARAALFSLAPPGDPLSGESDLKTLISDTPDAAHLHYSLGNLYAGQARWPLAQSAYFDAFRHAPDNADYAFNLAVSLDHMGQRAAALDYYRQALALAAVSDAGFNRAAVVGRVAEMERSQ